jgi:hypothetical protein
MRDLNVPQWGFYIVAGGALISQSDARPIVAAEND